MAELNATKHINLWNTIPQNKHFVRHNMAIADTQGNFPPTVLKPLQEESMYTQPECHNKILFPTCRIGEEPTRISDVVGSAQ